MMRCWQQSPNLRPTFTTLVKEIGNKLEKVTSKKDMESGYITAMDPSNETLTETDDEDDMEDMDETTDTIKSIIEGFEVIIKTEQCKMHFFKLLVVNLYSLYLDLCYSERDIHEDFILKVWSEGMGHSR